jgi:hypothetical protein
MLPCPSRALPLPHDQTLTPFSYNIFKKNCGGAFPPANGSRIKVFFKSRVGILSESSPTGGIRLLEAMSARFGTDFMAARRRGTRTDERTPHRRDCCKARRDHEINDDMTTNTRRREAPEPARKGQYGPCAGCAPPTQRLAPYLCATVPPTQRSMVGRLRAASRTGRSGPMRSTLSHPALRPRDRHLCAD